MGYGFEVSGFGSVRASPGSMPAALSLLAGFGDWEGFGVSGVLEVCCSFGLRFRLEDTQCPHPRIDVLQTVFVSFLLHSTLELSDIKVYEPQIRALLGTASRFFARLWCCGWDFGFGVWGLGSFTGVPRS